MNDELTDDFLTRFETLVGVGLDIARAGEALDVGRATIYEWMAKGGHPMYSHLTCYVHSSQSIEPFKSFVTRTLRAEAKSFIEPITIMHDRAKRDPEFALKWMKSRDPDNWSPTRRDNVPVVIEASPTISLSLADYLELRRLSGGNGNGPN